MYKDQTESLELKILSKLKAQQIYTNLDHILSHKINFNKYKVL